MGVIDQSSEAKHFKDATNDVAILKSSTSSLMLRTLECRSVHTGLFFIIFFKFLRNLETFAQVLLFAFHLLSV